MIKYILSFSVLLFSLISCNPSTKTESLEESKVAAIDELANRYLDLNRFSGTILISKGHSIVYQEHFGLADYENQKAFTDQTTFKVGELSELFTAGIIRKMAKDGQINLSDKVSTYLPELKADLSIKDFLDHATYLPSVRSIEKQHPDLDYTPVAYANVAGESEQATDYSELDYNILGELIESVHQTSFDEAIKKYNASLGLQNVYYQKQDSNAAVGYLHHNYRGQGLELQRAPTYDIKKAFSSYGLKSTAKDLELMVHAMTEKEIQKSGYLPEDGFSYSIHKDPETQATIVVLSNRRHPVADEISNSIRSILQDENYRLPLARKTVSIQPELLEDYAGFYALNPNMKLEIVSENDRLFVMMGPNKVELHPQSDNQFYMKESDSAIRFVRDSTDHVNQAVLLDGFLEGQVIEKVE